MSGKATFAASRKLCATRRMSGVRSSAAEALGRLGNPQAVEPLITALGSALRDKDWQVAESVVRALGTLADPRAAEVLTTALTAGDSDVSEASRQALGGMGLALGGSPTASPAEAAPGAVEEEAEPAEGTRRRPRPVPIVFPNKSGPWIPDVRDASWNRPYRLSGRCPAGAVGRMALAAIFASAFIGFGGLLGEDGWSGGSPSGNGRWRVLWFVSLPRPPISVGGWHSC